MTLLTVDRATSDELPTVLELLDDAAHWLNQRGITQWPAQFTGAEGWRINRIRAYVDNGHTWLVRTHHTPVATFTLSSADPDYADGWPDSPDTGLYIYRMAVLRTHAGHNIGSHILNWASARAAALGYHWLRLDCHRNNHALQHYYKTHGFQQVATLIRTINDPIAGDTNGRYTRASGALFQRPAGSIQLPNFPHTKEPPTMTFDKYEPHSEAAIWQQASNLVATLKTHDQPHDPNTWNTALDQASRLLERKATETRQHNGMNHRPLTNN